MVSTSLPKDRPTRHRMVLVLREAEERYRNELMDTEERLYISGHATRC